MKYRLKGENFEIVSGPDAGATYSRSREYDQIPAGYEDRFELIERAPAKPALAQPKKNESPPPEAGDILDADEVA